MKKNFLHLVSVLSLLQIYFALHRVDAIKSHKTDANNAVQAAAAPTISEITPVSCTLEVTWSCSSCPSTFDGFNVYWQQTGKESQSKKVSHQTNQYTINGLISSQSYTVWVASIIDDVETNSGKEQESTEKGVPYDVTGIQTETVSDSVIKVSWGKTSNPCPIQGYEVSFNGTPKWDDGIRSNGHRETDENTTSIEVDNLMPYSVYDFYVSEITTDGIIGNPYEHSTAETEEGAASAPDPVTSVALGPSSAQVNWGVPEAPNGVITGYHISCQILPDEKDDCNVTVGDDVFTHNVTTLLDCGEYTFSVQAVNEIDGLGEAGTHSSTTDAGEPGDITGFGWENKTSDTIFLIWDNLTTNCPVTKYDLHVEGNVLWNEKTENFNKDIPEEYQYFLLENLTPYTSYNISLRATTEGGTTNWAWQVVETDQGVAEAPEDLTASTVDDSTVSLSWSPSPAINGLLLAYHITCKKSLTDVIPDCDEYTGDLTYEVTGLDACTDYIFEVRAVNGYGDGEAATTKSYTGYEIPPSITNFEAVNVTSTTASLTWDPLLTNCPIFEYKLQIEETVLRTNETSAYEVSFLVENNFYLLEDLIPSAKYSLNLTATTGGGTSDPASTEFQTLEGDYDAPVIDGLTASSPCSLVVVWECDEVCSVGLNNFNVYWQQTGSEETLVVTEGYHTNFFEIQGLLSNTSYTVWVSSVKDDGEYNSPSSKASTYKGVPYDVTGVQTETVSDSVIKVSWDKTSNPCPIQGYEVSWNGAAKWDTEITLYGHRDTYENTTSVEVDNLIPYSVYDFYVSEITTDGIIGDPSEPSRADTEEGAASAPTPVTSLTLSSSSVQVNWSLPEAPNGVITGYHISCQLLPKTNDDCDIKINDINVFTATAETLLECGNYTISVQAVNGYGLGEPAETTATTYPEAPPNLTGFDAINITSTSASLIWDPLATNCPVLYYILEGKGVVLWSDDTDPISLVLNGENNYYYLDHLIPWTYYYLNIIATTDGGTSGSTSQEFETTEGVAAPPTDLISSTVDSSTVSLSWSPSPAINGELLAYHITCKEKLTDLINDCDEYTGDLAYEVTGLDGCTDYFFEVRAVNGYGDGEAATAKSSTANQTPGDMGDVTTSEVSSTNITITVEPPETTCEVLRYDVEGTGVAQWNENLTIPYKGTLVKSGVGNTYVIQDLNPYTAYTFNISATTAGGTTNGVSFEETTAEGVPSEPMNFKATVLDSRRVRLTWDEPEFQNGDRLLDYYLSYELLGMESEEIVLGKIVNTYTLGDDDSETLLPCQTYNIRLRASNENGIGSAASLRAKLDAEVPNAVSHLICNPVDPYTVELTWETQPTSCRIDHYQISLRGDILWFYITNSTLTIWEISSNEESEIVDGLIAYTMYYITVEAGNDAGFGEAASCSCETEPDVPSEPTSLALVNRTLTESGFNVTWRDPTFRNGIMEDFRIYLSYGGIIIEENTLATYSDDLYHDYYYSFAQLNSETLYTVSVAAENNVGVGNAAELTILTL